MVDWSEGSRTINYAGAAGRVGAVGAVIASQIDFMQQNNQINFVDIHIIGFSLGAHIAGHAGKNVRRGMINTIYGTLVALHNSEQCQ